MSSETSVAGCFSMSPFGKFYWTAGKAADPHSQSEFVWKVGAQDYPMAFYKWHVGEPSYDGQCVHMWEIDSYSWNDASCTSDFCSVCEVGK